MQIDLVAIKKRHIFFPDNVLAYLQRFDESPQECSNAFPFTQQLDQSHYSKQPEEGDRHPGAVLSTLKTQKSLQMW